MEAKKINSIPELEKFIDSERKESEIIEVKDYDNTIWEDKRDDIIKALCGLANNKGGLFVIGVNNDREIIYTDIDFDNFTSKLDNWVNDLIEPKGIKYRPDRITDNNGQCIIVTVDTTPSTCYVQKKKNKYLFPYRTYGSTRYYTFEEFFKICVHKFLRDVAISGELLERKEEKTLYTSIAGYEEVKPFNSELVNNYIDILRKVNSAENVNHLLNSIRNEAYKVYYERQVNGKDLPTIKNLVKFACEFIKDKDNIPKILDILYLLARAPEALQIVEEICYDYLVELYQKGERHGDLLKILDICGYFSDRIDKMMKAIEDKDQKLLGILISGLDFTEIRERKYKIIKQLFLKTETLDPESDKGILDKIKHLIYELENA